MRLAASRLPVGENRAIVAVQHVVDQRIAQVIVDGLGAHVGRIGRIEGELLGRCGSIGVVLQMNGGRVVIDANDVLDGGSNDGTNSFIRYKLRLSN